MPKNSKNAPKLENFKFRALWNFLNNFQIFYEYYSSELTTDQQIDPAKNSCPILLKIENVHQNWKKFRKFRTDKLIKAMSYLQINELKILNILPQMSKNSKFLLGNWKFKILVLIKYMLQKYFKLEFHDYAVNSSKLKC